MPTILTNGIQLPDKGSVDWYSSMESNYSLIDTHLGNTDIHVTAEDKANWDSKQGSLSQAQLDAIVQVATNTNDIASLQSGKANASHTHSSSDITDIGDYATKQYVDNSISGLVDNAPNALDTLNELAAALNDDSNFASTVTSALGAKANSADLATVATSGSYTDLSNKPTINDSTITIQKNGSTVDTFTTNGSNKTINIPVPTKTSDITNDSNFVDTSNPAVASGITSAKVTDYDSHIADTDIHVTAADKTKWNTGVAQAYVTRYTATSVSNNSTVAYSDLNNTDNIKIGDFLLDVNGKLFAITAVDTANETVSVTTPLTQLAVDSDVVHKSGNETIGGIKSFSSDLIIANTDTTANTPNLNLRNYNADRGTVETSVQTIMFSDKNAKALTLLESRRISNGNTTTNILCYNTDTNNNTVSGGVTIIKSQTETNFAPNSDNTVTCGSPLARWSKVYGIEYYYGNPSVEFSTKFVTTDTNQTINGNKTFGNGSLTVDNSVGSNVHGEIKLNGSRQGYIVADNSDDGVFDNAGCGVSILLQDSGKPLHIGGYKTDSNGRVFADNTNKNPVLSITGSLLKTATLIPENDTASSTFRILSQLDYANGSTSKVLDVRFQQYDNADSLSIIFSNADNKTSLGSPTKRWRGVYATNYYYGSGNIEFSTKFVTTDTAQTISGDKTFSSINGVEPSSLSLPSGNLNDIIDISSYLTTLDGSSANTYQAPDNGYVSITMSNSSGIQAYINGLWGHQVVRPSVGDIRFLMPILKNLTANILIFGGTIDNARFIPCQGNV